MLCYNDNLECNTNDHKLICYGCNDPVAINYNADATNSGDCEYLGCMDQLAVNYDEDANIDDDSCDYGPWGPIVPTDVNHQIAIPDYADIS